MSNNFCRFKAPANGLELKLVNMELLSDCLKRMEYEADDDHALTVADLLESEAIQEQQWASS